MVIANLFDAFLIDLDGVVYVGDKPINDAPETIKKLIKLGKKIIYLTNDPRKSSFQYSQRLSKLSIPSDPKHIITSASALILHIGIKNLTNKTAFVIGSRSLKNQLRKTGLKLISRDSRNKTHYVIVGGHNKVDYDDLKKATLCLRNGANFYATNNDPYYPTPEGLVPATGALVASIKTASGIKPTIVGKPQKIMFQIAKSMLNKNDKCAVIGDRLDTDIKGGIRARLNTILCLTGATKLDEVKKSKIKPDYIIKDLSYLLKDSSISQLSN